MSGFPTAAWLRSARRALGAAPAEAYGYGDPRGRIELRTALRLGWMVLPRRLLEPVVEAKRLDDHHTETLGQLTLADFITSHRSQRR
ncbi:hypothetical protein [Actinomadura sp. 6N118]|uniref:hypothetical protein n=1 Tax=Actinomadura sp. 6N118 TaxID=3375151 RepID=UPI0037B7076F